jgi:hypothetical protein
MVDSKLIWVWLLAKTGRYTVTGGTGLGGGEAEATAAVEATAKHMKHCTSLRRRKRTEKW